MNERRRSTTTRTLVTLALLGASARAEAMEPEPAPDAFTVEEAPEEAPEEPPSDDGFALEDEGGDEPIDEGTVVMPAAPSDDAAEEEPDDDGGWTFEVEDISDDEDAIEQEVAAATVEAKGGPTGVVRGVLKDSVTGDPLVGAQVEVVGGTYKTKTNAQGEYALTLPAGTHEIRLRSDSSQPLVSTVEVAQGDTVKLDRELRPLQGAGQVVEVQAEMNRESEGARLLQRKESVSARDLMSRDEISKSGGGSTSAVARRIVGSTVVGGRFLFVRGLGHRYGNTLFDGARVPSPEPELRTVPLDIFPSGALSAINIQKTFTPDVPADFAGGSTQLESRDVPEEFIFEASAEMGANTATTGREMVTGHGFVGADGFALGNRPRALPEALDTPQRIGRSVVGSDFRPLYTEQDIERFGEALDGRTRVMRARAPVNFGVKATTGYGLEYGKEGKVGFLASATYRAQHQTMRERIRLYAGPDGVLDVNEPQVDYQGIRTTYNVAWSGIGLAKWRPNANNRLEVLGFYSRDADDETRELRGTALSVSNTPVINTRQRYIMRSVLLSRLGGHHELPKANDLEIDWFGSYAQARRDDPAMRDMLFNTDGSEPVLDPTSGGGKQLFLDLVDHTESAAVDFGVPFQQWGGLGGKFSTGVWVEGKQREFFARRFAFQRAGSLPLPVGLGDVLGPDTIGGGDPMGTVPLYVEETTRANDNYDAQQEIYAGYAMVDLPLVRWLKLAGGARFEASHIDVEAFDLFDRSAEVANGDAALRDYDVLPSVSFIFAPTQKMNVRLTGTQTLARPEFRELAPFEFTDFVGGATVIGFPGLQSSKIWNADMRWEWFPSVAEVVAVSVFYKYFDKPIERVAGSRIPRLVSFRNAERAQNIGAELEVRKNLAFLGEAVEDFSLGTNFAYVFSRVELGDCDPFGEGGGCDGAVSDVSTSRVRPLQGQSPFVVNAYLDYTNDRSGTTARFLYNAFGRRIAEVGANRLPDIYEESIHNFDFVLGQQLAEGLTLSLSVENLVNYPRRFTQGPDRAVTYLAWPGTTFGLGLTYRI